MKSSKLAKGIALAIGALGLSQAFPAAAQVAHLTLTLGMPFNPERSYDITYTPENSDHFSISERYRLPSGEVSYLAFVLGTVGGEVEAPFLTIDFGTQKLPNQALTVGTYTDTERAMVASAGHPGFDISFKNQGNNAVWGSFTIDSILFSTEGKLLEFSSSFQAYGSYIYGTDFVATYTGTFTYNAVREPDTAALFGIGLTALGLQAARRRWQRTS